MPYKIAGIAHDSQSARARRDLSNLALVRPRIENTYLFEVAIISFSLFKICLPLTWMLMPNYLATRDSVNVPPESQTFQVLFQGPDVKR